MKRDSMPQAKEAQPQSQPQAQAYESTYVVGRGKTHHTQQAAADTGNIRDDLSDGLDEYTEEADYPPLDLMSDLEPTAAKGVLIKVAFAIGLVGIGALIGGTMAPEGGEELRQEIARLEQRLLKKQGKIDELSRTLSFQATQDSGGEGHLSRRDRQRHLQHGRLYARALIKAGAQPAAELMNWFIGRWNSLLDHPQSDDRTTRRAKALSQLIGGMVKNLHPGDYVPWQSELLEGKWLGELHMDIDGDGLPAKRNQPNPKDGFVDTSVCQVAMALNQAVSNAQILMMPQMRCDSPNAKISVFFQGRTINDALNEFAAQLRTDGFIVIEKKQKKMRMLLVGPAAK